MTLTLNGVDGRPAPGGGAGGTKIAAVARRLAMGTLAQWQGAPAALLRKETLVEAVPETGQLPVRTLTFAAPATLAEGFRIDLGHVVKVVIPEFKPKSYTMSAARQGEFDLTVKMYPGGRCSGYLDSVAVGESISVFRRGVKERRPGARVGLVAFGVGITEALPIARAEVEKPDAREIHLLWGARTFGDMFWHEEIAALEREHPGRFRATSVLSREDRKGCRRGRIDAGALADVFGGWRGEADTTRFLVVGTKAMMREAERNLEAAGFPWPASALLAKPSSP